MRPGIRYLDRLLALGAAVLGVVSVFLRDADKSPLYFLLAYILWRLGSAR